MPTRTYTKTYTRTPTRPYGGCNGTRLFGAHGRHRRPRPRRMLFAAGGLALAAGALSLVRLAPESGIGGFGGGTAEAGPRPHPRTGTDRATNTAATVPAVPGTGPSATSVMGGLSASPTPATTTRVVRAPAGASTPTATAPAGTTTTDAPDIPVPTATQHIPAPPSTAPRPTDQTGPSPDPGRSTPTPEPGHSRHPGICVPIISVCVDPLLR